MDKGPYVARYFKGGLVADTAAVVVDLSNTTTFPHNEASGVVPYALRFRVKGTAGSAGNAVLYIGIVLENDATNGTAGILAASDTVVYNQEFDSGWHDYKGGLANRGPNLSIVSGALPYASLLPTGDYTVLQNDAGNLEDTEGNTNVSAGAGDLVAILDEGTDGGTYEIEVEVVWGTP